MSLGLLSHSPLYPQHLAKFLAHIGSQEIFQSEWTNELFFYLSGCAQSYWAYKQLSSMYVLVKPYVALLFHRPHTQTTAFYDLSASVPFCLVKATSVPDFVTAHACYSPQFLPSVNVISLSSMFSPSPWTHRVLQLATTDSYPDQHVSIVTLCLVTQARCKSTWPQCYWPMFLQLAYKNTVQDSATTVRCFTEIQNTMTIVLQLITLPEKEMRLSWPAWFWVNPHWLLVIITSFFRVYKPHSCS